MNSSYIAPPPRDSLARLSVKGGFFIFSSQLVKQLISVLIIVVLARLINPFEFGLFGMVFAFYTLANIFVDLGLSMATIQRKNVNYLQLSNLFWINIILGIILSLFFFLSSEYIANFYREPRICTVSRLFSVAFFLSAIGIQHKALLTRQMKFLHLSLAELFGLILGSITSIILALLGLGVFALVFQSLVSIATTSILYWIFAFWIPSLPCRGTGVRQMIKFGGTLTINEIIAVIVRNVDKLLIGRYFGAYSLALYNKAFSLLLLPLQNINGAISRVVLPALSSLKDDHDNYKSYFNDSLLIVLSMSIPLTIYLFVAADSIVLLVLGPKWIESVIYFRILSISTLVAATGIATNWFLFSLGMLKRILYISIIRATVILFSYYIGLSFGATGIAFAFSISVLLLRIPIAAISYHSTFYSLSEFFAIISRPLLSSLLSLSISLLIFKYSFKSYSSLAFLFISFVFFFSIFVSAWILIPGGYSLFKRYFIFLLPLQKNRSQ